MSNDLIYLRGDVDDAVERVLSYKELKNCNLGKRKVAKCLKSFGGDELACVAFLKKYALRDNNDEILEFTLNEAKNRWASTMAEAEKLFDGRRAKSQEYFRELYEYMLPAGRQMYALGNPHVAKATLSNCYVTKIEDDSIEGIFEAAKKTAKTFSYGGGIGLCIGELRPADARVSNSARYSSGAVSFMDLYSLTTGLIGQCVAEGERVLTKNGLVAIEDIKTNDEVWTKEGYKKVVNFFNSGEKEVYEIKDEFGFKIRLSKDHVVMSEENGNLREMKVDDLEVGDPIVLIPGIPRNIPYLGLDTKKYEKKNYSNKYNRLNEDVMVPNKLDEKLAYILGYSYGDGSVEYDKFNEPYALSLSCSNDWPNIKVQLCEYITEKFNYIPTIKRGDGDLEVLNIHSKVVLHFLQNNKLLKKLAVDLIFPEKITRSPSSVQMAFISGLFDADGKKVNKKRGYAISMVPYDFLQQIKSILMSNGIVSRNNFESRSHLGWRDLHGISVAGTCAQSRARELLNMSVKVREANFISKKDSYITPFISRSLGIKYNKYDYVPSDNYMSCNCFERIKKDGIKLSELLVKSHVESIEKVGPTQTYDIQVEEENRFYCEGFYIHNCGRRGAQMVTIPVNHPDIERFIEAKHINKEKLEFVNISVKITDDFMKAVETNDDFILSFKTYHETIERKVKARELWNKIIQSATDSAEPGILFWDRMVEKSPSEVYPSMRIHSTNPCGEQSLEPGGACCLGSLLLHKFVENPFTEEAKFNYELFSTMIWRAVRHLDNIVELNIEKHALEEQEEAAKAGRRIGLGITGLADMLVSLGIRYDSEEALKLVNAIMEFKKLQEYGASIDLARERGPFPLFDAKKHFSRGFCADLPQDLKDLAYEHGLRNVAISTVAPNGTISVVAQCSSGIEPIFALSYSRTVQMGDQKQEFKVFHQGLARFLDYYEENMDDDLNDDLSNLPDYWVVSHEINYENRVKLQGVVQRHVDASISSTINLPKGTEPKMVDTIYRTAWKAGLKGVTVYVEGSRKGILVTDEFAKQAGIPSMNSVVHCVRAEGGDKFYIIVSYYNREIDKPYQVFVMNYKKAECDAFVKIGNALIKMLREQKISEKRIQKYIDRSTNSLAKLTRFLSLSMKTNNLERALSILDEHAFAGTLAAKLYQILSDSAVAKKSKCPMCGSTNLRMEEGCLRCLDCQWSGCN